MAHHNSDLAAVPPYRRTASLPRHHLSLEADTGVRCVPVDSQARLSPAGVEAVVTDRIEECFTGRVAERMAVDIEWKRLEIARDESLEIFRKLSVVGAVSAQGESEAC